MYKYFLPEIFRNRAAILKWGERWITEYTGLSAYLNLLYWNSFESFLAVWERELLSKLSRV
jgi:hypothetical protein